MLLRCVRFVSLRAEDKRRKPQSLKRHGIGIALQMQEANLAFRPFRPHPSKEIDKHGILLIKLKALVPCRKRIRSAIEDNHKPTGAISPVEHRRDGLPSRFLVRAEDTTDGHIAFQFGQ